MSPEKGINYVQNSLRQMLAYSYALTFFETRVITCETMRRFARKYKVDIVDAYLGALKSSGGQNFAERIKSVTEGMLEERINILEEELNTRKLQLENIRNMPQNGSGLTHE